MRSSRTGFQRGSREDGFDKPGVESRAQRDRLWVACSINGRMSVEAFFMEDHRNPEPRVFNKELLDGIRSFCHFARIQALACVAWPSDLPQPMAVFEELLGLGQIKVAVRIHECLWFLLPDTEHLRGFFFEGHAGKKVLHPLFRGECRIAVRRNA